MGKAGIKLLGELDKSKGLTATAANIDTGKTALVDGVVLVGTSAKVNTADATATAADILAGKVAYAKGVRLNGELKLGVQVGRSRGTYNGSTYGIGCSIDLSSAPSKTKEIKAIVFAYGENWQAKIRPQGLAIDGVLVSGFGIRNMTASISENIVSIYVEFTTQLYVGEWEYCVFYV